MGGALRAILVDFDAQRWAYAEDRCPLPQSLPILLLPFHVAIIGHIGVDLAQTLKRIPGKEVEAFTPNFACLVPNGRRHWIGRSFVVVDSDGRVEVLLDVW